MTNGLFWGCFGHFNMSHHLNTCVLTRRFKTQRAVKWQCNSLNRSVELTLNGVKRWGLKLLVTYLKKMLFCIPLAATASVAIIWASYMCIATFQTTATQFTKENVREELWNDSAIFQNSVCRDVFRLTKARPMQCCRI